MPKAPILHSGAPAADMYSKSRDWRRLARARLAAQWRLKTWASTAFIVFFFAGYFSLLKFPAFPATTMPTTALDRLIPFSPHALVWYLSLWLYVQIPVGLMLTRAEIFDYGKRISALALAGFLIFFLWPTRLAPSDINAVQHPAFHFLQGVDASGNACPSLHVAFAVFSAISIERSLKTIQAPFALQILNTAWCLAIVYSTIATRQHVALDVLAGTVLAAVTWAICHRRNVTAPSLQAVARAAPVNQPQIEQSAR